MDEDQRDPKTKAREERARAAAKSIGLILMDVKGWAGWFWLADPETGIAVAGGSLVKDALTIEEVEKEIRGRGGKVSGEQPKPRKRPGHLRINGAQLDTALLTSAPSPTPASA